MTTGIYPLSKETVLKFLGEPDFLIENADFSGMECASFDIVKHEILQELIVLGSVLHTATAEYCLPVFTTIDDGQELNFWLNFTVKIDSKLQGLEVKVDPAGMLYDVSLSDSSSLIEGMDSEETQLFINRNLKWDRRLTCKVIEKAIGFYISHLHELDK